MKPKLRSVTLFVKHLEEVRENGEAVLSRSAPSPSGEDHRNAALSEGRTEPDFKTERLHQHKCSDSCRAFCGACALRGALS